MDVKGRYLQYSMMTSIMIIRGPVVFTEQPNLTISILPLTNPPAPAVHLAFSQDFTISCSLLYDYDGINSTSCDQYVTQPRNIHIQDFPFVGTFSPKGNVMLTRYDDTGPYFVQLYVNIKDPKFNNDTQELMMTAYDAESEYVYDTERKYFDPSLSPYEESLFYMNKYTLTGNLLFKLGYSRKTRKTLIPTFLNYVGIPPENYFTQHYIESTIQDVPAQPSNTAFPDWVESMKPWGFIHTGCCGFRRETKVSLIPILESGTKEQLENSKSSAVTETPTELGSSTAPEILSERIRELESFRIFIEDFVVDTSLLESVKKEQKRRQRLEKQQPREEVQDS
ncbi:7353_t:CDS:2 [Entrophospora sp. SA101]|nr:7353_t:CDS:2 [Entrophospora sp. SA101]